jgi:hypothetical protein
MSGDAPDLLIDMTLAGAPVLPNGVRGAAGAPNLYAFDYVYTSGVRPLERLAAGKTILERFLRDEPHIDEVFATIAALKPFFAAIPAEGADDATPNWGNPWLPAGDAAVIYGLIASRRPRLYLEVGSGNSTKFARRAIVDHGLDTQIISIDPEPRADIDLLCSAVIRAPVEKLNLDKVAGWLQPSDVVFIDNSHRSFPNSDVTVCCLELTAALPDGVAYGFHDIFLPFDYPAAFVDRFYNEQYLLAMYLLGGADGDRIIAPTYAATRGLCSGTAFAAMLDVPTIPLSARAGGALWLERARRGA